MEELSLLGKLTGNFKGKIAAKTALLASWGQLLLKFNFKILSKKYNPAKHKC